METARTPTQDPSTDLAAQSACRREIGLRALRQLVSGTGAVVQPYFDRPLLMGVLLKVVKREPSRLIRHEAVLRLFPPCALVSRAQGSSGAVATVQFVWRGHAKTPTTRAGPWPDFALRLE